MNEDTESAFRFAPDADGSTNMAHDQASTILAVCVVHQQNAGFKNYIDLRRVECPSCSAAGFNTGWGYWLFACGAEILSDGEVGAGCQHTQPSGPSGGDQHE
ncbi:hypothetical protein BSL82_15805 [Tardibacter chloracetimidivorans]|uniref:Uncharacterized protein n=2 Tax=Tardibacter chloracetimidivorans TaxID=1921510 RepID=A0A1L3ZY82_9SPHN|nr:hypothetical protein BSL82_09400 [Tardibacter chloracetimidivorans]API60570.1 hypothetical protein BSL82_15805 [Tardibacter chloracetimidivorans]